MALRLKHHHLRHPQRHLPCHLLPRHCSSSPAPPDPPESSNPPDPENPDRFSSLFSDIKSRLKSSSANPPRLIPRNAPPPPLPGPASSPPASLHEVKQHLASFRNRATAKQDQSKDPAAATPPPSDAQFRDMVTQSISRVRGSGQGDGFDFDSIRKSLRDIRRTDSGAPGFPRERPLALKSLQSFRSGDPSRMQQPELPGSISGQEVSGGEGTLGGAEAAEQGVESSNELRRMYDYEELGEMLKKLGPEDAAKGGGKEQEEFSLSEFNERLVKLRELEKQPAVGLSSVLKDSLHKLSNQDKRSRGRSS